MAMAEALALQRSECSREFDIEKNACEADVGDGLSLFSCGFSTFWSAIGCSGQQSRLEESTVLGNASNNKADSAAAAQHACLADKRVGLKKPPRPPKPPKPPRSSSASAAADGKRLPRSTSCPLNYSGSSSRQRRRIERLSSKRRGVGSETSPSTSSTFSTLLSLLLTVSIGVLVVVHAISCWSNQVGAVQPAPESRYHQLLLNVSVGKTPLQLRNWHRHLKNKNMSTRLHVGQK